MVDHAGVGVVDRSDRVPEKTDCLDKVRYGKLELCNAVIRFHNPIGSERRRYTNIRARRHSVDFSRNRDNQQASPVKGTVVWRHYYDLSDVYFLGFDKGIVSMGRYKGVGGLGWE